MLHLSGMLGQHSIVVGDAALLYISGSYNTINGGNCNEVKHSVLLVVPSCSSQSGGNTRNSWGLMNLFLKKLIQYHLAVVEDLANGPVHKQVAGEPAEN